MKKKRLILSILALAVIFIFVLPLAADVLDIPVSKSGGKITVTIEDNTSTIGIADILKDNGLIRSKIAFVARVKTSKYSGKLTSGTYTLSKSMSVKEICDKLSEPKVLRQTVNITFPEGYTVQQMAQALDDKGIVSQDAFLSALTDSYDYDFISYIPDGEYDYALQGFLFPDTYEFFTDSTAHEIIDKMLLRFNEVYTARAQSFQGIFEVMTKASMIEKEAKLDSERATVAGVIENRTRKGMAYQIDACVLYAATDGLYNREESAFIAKNIKELDSPYNTYMYAGLPAGPICNPGITSIEAALNPEAHNYLYYHTDTSKNDGSHIFTETFNEHVGSMN